MANPVINVPPMCNTHRVLLVRQCAYRPQDPWRALELATQIALFQGASADSKVFEEVYGQLENFRHLGCLACRKPDLFGTLIDTVQRTFPRDAHIGAIKKLGEQWVAQATKDQPAEGADSKGQG